MTRALGVLGLTLIITGVASAPDLTISVKLIVIGVILATSALVIGGLDELAGDKIGQATHRPPTRPPPPPLTR